MTGKTIAKVIFLVVITICAVISLGSGIVLSKRFYKGNETKRTRLIVKVRLICFLVMLVMLLLIVVIV